MSTKAEGFLYLQIFDDLPTKTSKLEVDPPGDLKRRKVPVLESISGGTHLRVIQTN